MKYLDVANWLYVFSWVVLVLFASSLNVLTVVAYIVGWFLGVLMVSAYKLAYDNNEVEIVE
jgi:hypothetical protein